MGYWNDAEFILSLFYSLVSKGRDKLCLDAKPHAKGFVICGNYTYFQVIGAG
jgi:hypothetical protein